MSGANEVRWFLGIVLSTEAVAIFASLGFRMERRAHFGLRILLLCLAPIAAVLVLWSSVKVGLLSDRAGVTTALVLLLACLPALALMPRLLYLRSDSSSNDDSDGGEPVHDLPPSPPRAPSGSPLLPDSAPGSWRLRDHRRPDRGPVHPRRRSREPQPKPAPSRGSAL